MFIVKPQMLKLFGLTKRLNVVYRCNDIFLCIMPYTQTNLAGKGKCFLEYLINVCLNAGKDRGFIKKETASIGGGFFFSFLVFVFSFLKYL